MGLEIEFNRDVKPFVYLKKYEINITFNIRELTTEEATKTEAGINFLKANALCNSIAQTEFIFEAANK